MKRKKLELMDVNTNFVMIAFISGQPMLRTSVHFARRNSMSFTIKMRKEKSKRKKLLIRNRGQLSVVIFAHLG